MIRKYNFENYYYRKNSKKLKNKYLTYFFKIIYYYPTDYLIILKNI